MAIYFGNDKIKDIYYGSEPIEEVYYGSELVWRKKEYIQDGYWVHKDTGVKTYFGAGGVMSPPSWRYDCSEVKLPSEVTGLENRCFNGSTSLTSINIPEGVTSIGLFCFYGCSSLASINIPEGVPILGSECFYNCTSLTSITIPESVTNIGQSCFRNCRALILVTVLSSTPPTLGARAFESVHTSFNIKVRYPYVNAYKAATNWRSYSSKISGLQDGYWVGAYTGVKTYFGLEDSSIVDGIMGIPYWNYDCSEVKIPYGVTGLGDYCFNGCTDLTSIDIPKGVTSLGYGCFSGCSSLTSITLAEGVTSLGVACFNGCTSLTSIILPESVTSLGEVCFFGCTSLILATVLPIIPPSLGDGAFANVHRSFSIKVLSPYVNTYKTATNWISYNYLISAI